MPSRDFYQILTLFASQWESTSRKAEESAVTHIVKQQLV